MNKKLLSTTVFMLILAIASFANNLDSKPSPKEAVDLKGITDVQVFSIKSTTSQTCTVTLGSWIQLGFAQVYYTVSASAETCAEAAKSAGDQMNAVKNYLNQTNIE